MKPQSIAPQYDSFPAELRARPVWLVWNYRWIKDRWTKVPSIAEPGGGGAKSNDPATWRSFEQAVKVGQRASGVGLCFVEDYCGIDLDCCRDQETGAVAPWAQKIVDHLHSYTEVSPSGEGLHIIVRLDKELPEGRRKWGGKEKGWEIAVYDRTSPRYFCATGRFLEGSSEIRVCALDEFYPQFNAGEFDPEWTKATKAAASDPVVTKPNGHDKKESLLRGEWEGRYPSQSEADAALVWYLAAELGDDAVAIDREFRKSGLMRPKWDRRNGSGTYGERTIAACLKKKTEPILAPPTWTEDDLTLKLVETYPDLCYVDDWKRWLCYETAGVWRKDNSRSVFDRAKEICRAASDTLDLKQVGALKWLRSAKTRAAVENLAREHRNYAAVPEQWDADIKVLNTTAGACLLKEGVWQIRAHRREDYCTKSTSVAPEAGVAPLWISFLDTITAGNVELRSYLQRMAGYCLTGLTTEHVLFFLYGTGANGKTTFTNTLLGILGSYGQVAAIETFTENRNDRHPTELAALRGARLVVASETGAGKHWAESRIKALTGGQPIRARFMQCDEFEYVPQFKLVIQGNHKPALRSVDEAIRRRVHMIPFTVTIPLQNRDRRLSEKLKAEWPQILTWALDGSVQWRAVGLKPPDVVCNATEEYFASEDAILGWLEERVIVSPQAGRTKSSVLYRDFKDWAEKAGEYCGSQKRFSQELMEHGYTHSRSDGTWFEGVVLRVHGQIGQDEGLIRL